MYYALPIMHNPDRNDEGDFGRRTGDFGMVRNNWYSITVDQINKLGTPVDDFLQPIVPVMDVKRSYINMGVKLLDWHNITQDNIPMM